MQLFTKEVVPQDLVMTFGDAIHNLRSALDMLINEIVTERRTPPTDLAFPFARSAETLGKQIREKMKETTPAERELIRSMRPYKGGNELLVALHELDLKDKHRSPIDISVAVVSHRIKFDGYRPDGAPNMRHEGAFSKVPSDIEPLLNPVPGATRVGVIDDARLIPSIAQGLPMEKEPIIESLEKLAQSVEDVIVAFTSLLDPQSLRAD